MTTKMKTTRTIRVVRWLTLATFVLTTAMLEYILREDITLVFAVLGMCFYACWFILSDMHLEEIMAAEREAFNRNEDAIYQHEALHNTVADEHVPRSVLEHTPRSVADWRKGLWFRLGLPRWLALRLPSR